VAIDVVIARGMAKNPADRFGSAGELAEACLHALGLVAEASSVEISPADPADDLDGAPSRSAPTIVSQ
jgi:serine/threonine-protein kinase